MAREDRLAGLVMAVVLAIGLVGAVVNWLIAHGWVMGVVALLAGAAAGAWLH
ncbi:hypothetical protein [Streptomyces wuyuanensis]|uniref:hypothetical protein n=1 Tax=Streptomyces wuyuanensis TaxID=1196353 RepID=UPI0037178745